MIGPLARLLSISFLTASIIVVDVSGRTSLRKIGEECMTTSFKAQNSIKNVENYSNDRRIAALALPSPLDIVKRDLLALTRRVTARHILLPKSTDAVIALKQNIRNRVFTGGEDDEETKMYVEDAFSAASRRFSKDEETALTGGLLGTLVPQGYCRAIELDRACFEVPLGEIAGPIESDFGYHLLLVTERTNCPNLDGGYTRIVRGGTNGKLAILTGPPAGSKTLEQETTEFALSQVAFWILVTFAGGILAEVAAKAAGVLEPLP